MQPDQRCKVAPDANSHRTPRQTRREHCPWGCFPFPSKDRRRREPRALSAACLGRGGGLLGGLHSSFLAFRYLKDISQKFVSKQLRSSASLSEMHAAPPAPQPWAPLFPVLCEPTPTSTCPASHRRTPVCPQLADHEGCCCEREGADRPARPRFQVFGISTQQWGS